MFFKCTPRGILPEWLHKTNLYDSPKNALVFMGILVTVIVLLTNFLPSVNLMYQALILMATVHYFIPYLYLVVAYIKLMDSSEKS
ncbi:amino acid permease, partial [Francisella tularensis]|uniref:amino acid permease n=1 Tax=Francisella tularensis TaxID=263 RepID=UPI002381CAA7